MKYTDLEKVNKDIKTLNIKGKEYADVASRIDAFRKIYPDGFIITEMTHMDDTGMVIFTAKVGFYREDGSMQILATGTSYERANSSQINRTSFIENAETSAVGRAIGMVGIGLGASIASANEVQNAIFQQENPAHASAPAPKGKKCAVCGKIETDALIIKGSMDRWGKVVCRECIDRKRKEMTEMKQAQGSAPAPTPAPVPEPEPEPPIEVPDNLPFTFD